MAEWGKYLKNAVANVEQQLDKVLLENQNQTQSPRASISPSPSIGKPSRPDLQERLRRAATASKGGKVDSNVSTPQPESKKDGIGAPEEVVGAGVDDGAESGAGADPESGSKTELKTEAATQTKAKSNVPSEVSSGATNGATNGASEASLEDATKPDAKAPATNENPASTIAPETLGDMISDSPQDIVTTQKLVLTPDFGPLLNQARKIALAHQGDDTLALVDALEAFKNDYDAFDDNVRARIRSVNSKIAYLSQDKAATASGSEQRVALLLEEGQRLSQQELKLGLIIKRMRAERSALVSKETVVQTKDKELAVLRAERTAIMNQLKEQEALAEHFRGLAESASVGGAFNASDSNASSAGDGSDGGDPNRNSYTNLKRRLDAATSNHEVAKRTWHDLESSLLTRIAELELNAEARATSAAQLQDNLSEAQNSARETRNQMISLQNDLDANQEKWLAAEKHHRIEINELQDQLKKEQLRAIQTQTELDRQVEKLRILSETGPELKEPVDESSVPPSPRGQLDADLNHSTVEHNQADIYEHPGASLKPYNDDSFRNSSEFLNGPDGPVGPSGPFGSLADDFDSEHRPSLSRDDSRDLFEDSFSFMAPSASRRESSIVGSEAVGGSQLHIVKKLTLTVRRLENELSTVRKACELSERQRDEAQSEVVRLVDAQDNLAVLQQKYAELEKTNDELATQVKRLETTGVDKDERIEELEADVRDLKDMYREQVEALVTEIEGLKK